MTNVIPVTQARKDFLKLVDRVEQESLRIDLTKRGRVKAVLISSDYVDSLEETAEVLSIPGAKKSITQGVKEAKKRLGVLLSELK